MLNTRMLGRLLWLEFRGGWLSVAIAAITPWAAFAAAPILPDGLAHVAAFIGLICSPVAILLWAAAKGARRKDENRLPLAHLPLNRLAESLVVIVLPVIVSALAGAWWQSHVSGSGLFPIPNAHHASVVYFGALYMAFAFATCYLLSAAIGGWAGAAAAVVLVILAVQWNVDAFDMRALPELTWDSFIVRDAIGVALALALFLFLSRIGRLRIGQVTSVALLTAVVLGPPLQFLFLCRSQHLNGYARVVCTQPVYSSDRSMVMMPVPAACGTTIHFIDRAAGWSLTKTFDEDVRPIACDSAGHGYVAQQLRGSDVCLIACDANRCKQVALMPAGDSALRPSDNGDPPVGSVSPDGRYLAFSLMTLNGKGTDVWVTNLRTGDSWVAIANEWRVPRHTSWSRDRLVISGAEGIWSVDLRAMRTAPLRIRDGNGG
jgi:hypothetical protein